MRRYVRVDDILKRVSIGEKKVLFLGVLTLLVTSCSVGYYGALVHAYNYDQSIINYLFDSFETAKEAIMPLEHTFFLKWPLFALGGLLGNTHSVFIALTIGVYLATVCSLLAVIFYATGKRYDITALMAFVLSALLLLIPAQQSPGDVMPVNMAMITTRNIEYVLYILFCYFAVKSRKLFDNSGTLSFLLIFLLIISDSLMFYLAALGSVLYILHGYYRTRKIDMSRLSILMYVALAYIGSRIVIAIINMLGFIRINVESASVSDTTNDSVQAVFNAILNGIEAVMRNFGADIFNDRPSLSLLIGFAGLLFFGVCLYATKERMTKGNARLLKNKLDAWDRAGELLVFSALAAFLFYIGIKRGDGLAVRYLGIFLFAGVYMLTLWLRDMNRRSLRKVYFPVIGLLIAFTPVALVYSVYAANVSIKETSSSVFGIKDADFIADTLEQKDVDLLIGIYYISVLSRYESNNALEIVPVTDYGCLPTVKRYLTSMYWYSPHRESENTAVYVINDGNKKKTINNGCPSDVLEDKLGHPSEVVTIPDSPGRLYIYDYDVRQKLFKL